MLEMKYYDILYDSHVEWKFLIFVNIYTYTNTSSPNSSLPSTVHLFVRETFKIGLNMANMTEPRYHPYFYHPLVC